MQDLFGFIIHPMELGVIWLSNLVGSAGIGIILFTMLVRLVLAPLLITQLRSSRAMQRIQPQIAELRQKHGKDRQALSQATMQLYKDNNVNPAMGCLPTLLQFPILIGLFYAFLHLGDTNPFLAAAKGAAKVASVHCNGHLVTSAQAWYDQCYRVTGAVTNSHHVYSLFHATFLWLSNGLGKPDPLFILPLLAGATQWIQSRMMLQTTQDPQQKMMNTMMNFMPLLIIFFATRYASGLSLYWVTSTVIAIAIQYRITGWGLLPRPSTLMTARALTFPSRTGGSRPQTRAGDTKAIRKTSDGSKPAKMSVGTGRKIEPANSSNGLVPGSNGQNGSTSNDGEGTNLKRAATVPRKKANRARGGRGGGRRG